MRNEIKYILYSYTYLLINLELYKCKNGIGISIFWNIHCNLLYMNFK